MAEPELPALYVGMSNDEMHAFLKESCGVEVCTFSAQGLFDAAVSSTPTPWAFVRSELNLQPAASLELQCALANVVQEALPQM